MLEKEEEEADCDLRGHLLVADPEGMLLGDRAVAKVSAEARPMRAQRCGPEGEARERPLPQRLLLAEAVAGGLAEAPKLGRGVTERV